MALKEGRDRVEVFVTKYALSSGVSKAWAEVQDDKAWVGYAFLRYGEFAHTEEEALAQVAKMVESKFKSISKARDKAQDVADKLRKGLLPMADGDKS